MRAPWTWAVARMILSAIGNLSSWLIPAARTANSSESGTTAPAWRMETARRASSSLRCCKTRLQTSKMTIVGTINSALRVMAGSKKPAFGPSAKYSSQEEESTKFSYGPLRATRAYRSREGSRASVLPPAPGSIRCALCSGGREIYAQARDRALPALVLE